MVRPDASPPPPRFHSSDCLQLTGGSKLPLQVLGFLIAGQAGSKPGGQAATKPGRQPSACRLCLHVWRWGMGHEAPPPASGRAPHPLSRGVDKA